MAVHPGPTAMRGDVRSWQPLVPGALAQDALAASGDIMAALAALPRDKSDASLMTGQAGLALAFAWASRASGADASWVHLAWQCLDAAADALSTRLMDPSLFSGVAGIAWSSQLVDDLLNPGGGDGDTEVDEYLLELLRRRLHWAPPHDLVEGVTGVGVYALRRYPRPPSVECLQHVVATLAEVAERDDEGAYWWMAADAEREPYPFGHADLGMAHGVTGVIGLLARLSPLPEIATVAAPLLQDSVRWLLAHAVGGGTGATFPDVYSPALTAEPTRSAWCYGDPGVAASLLFAGRALHDGGVERAAVELACRAASLPDEQTDVVDGGFCHGSAGLAHLYNRLYQSTGEPVLGAAARHWLERTLDYYRRARAGWTESGDRWVEGRPFGPWNGVDLIEGAAGVALVLLAAATDVEPEWDGMFLLSPSLTGTRGPTGGGRA